MADGTTPNLGLTKPEVGLSYNTWGEKINGDLDILDTVLGALEPQQLVGLSGPGLAVAVDASNFVPRSVAVGSGLSVSNGSGAAGNPTISQNPTGLTAKTLPVDADEVMIADSAASYAAKKSTRTNFLKAALHTAPRRVLSNLGTPLGNIGFDLDTSDTFLFEVSGPKTAIISNGPAGKAVELTLIIINAGSNLSFAGHTWLWPGGAAPTFTTSGVDIVKALWTGVSNTVYAWRVAVDVR
jgi:hypothetical protein